MPQHSILRPVWVRLAKLFPFPEHAAPADLPTEALDLSWDAPGVLHFWMRSGRGGWIGQVDYELKYADGRDEVLELADQWVPAYALRPRKYGSCRGQT